MAAACPSAEAVVRLGDVVATQPHRTFAGVVQYDMGKTTPSGFERTASLNAPPQILLAAIARVRANELRGRSKLSEHVAKLEGIAKFQRSKAGPDVLFEATYDHEAGQTCDGCNLSRQDARQARDSGEEVAVHYGTIASGNQVMRSAAERDRVSAELGGVLCFEMEAAGLLNSFPCLVVRGICDYADSHKNKRWQPYAAATAAAYAKEVLSVIPPAEVTKALALDKTIRQATTKRHLDGDSACRSSKRAKLSHSKVELDGPEYNEGGKTSSEDSEGATSEDGESGSSEDGESGSSEDGESESSEDGEQNDSESESDDKWH